MSKKKNKQNVSLNLDENKADVLKDNEFIDDTGKVQKTPDPYDIDKAAKIPAWIKVAFIKFWAGGAVFFFVGWGTFINTLDQWDLVVALGLVLGLVSDLVVNNVLRFMERGDKHAMNRFMLFPKKTFYGIFIYCAYCTVLAAIIAYFYSGVNLWINAANGYPEGTVKFGAEPLLYGVLFLLLDTLFTSLKNAIARAINRGKQKEKDGEEKNENL